MTLRSMLISLGIFFSLVSVAVIAAIADWNSGVGPIIVVFLLIPMIPLALPVAGGIAFQKSKAALITCLAGLISAFAFMTMLFVSAFFINPDPQGALVIIFGPIYATIGLIPFGIVALIFFLKAGNKNQVNP